VSDAEAAITYLKTNHVDCVVSEYDIPGCDGIEFLETVREMYPELPFIFYTTASPADAASEAIANGATDYLQKGTDPVYTDLLATRIQHAVARRRAEQRAQQLEYQCVDLAEETNNILCTFTPDMADVTFVNSAFADLYGIPIDRVCEDSLCFLEATHPDDRLHVEQAITRMQDGQPIDIEYRVNEQDEYERWVHMQGKPIHTDDDDIARIVVFITEITERKEREQQLRQFQQAVESSGRPFYFTDRDGVIEYVNPAFEATTGYTAEEVIGESPQILKSGEHDESFYEDLWETLLDGETWHGEVINQRKNGERFILDQTIAPVTDETGEIVHFVATSNEITEQKVKEDKRKQVINRMTDGIFELDANWRCTLVSDQAESILSRSKAEVSGRDFWEVFADVKGTPFEQHYREVMTTREPASFVEYYAALDRWFEVEVYPNDDGGIAIYFRDVTDLKKREHHLELLDRVLRHNLRNAINVIRGRAELIHDRSKNGLGEMAQQIVESSDDLIDIAEKERQLVEILVEEPTFKEIDLSYLLNEIVSKINTEHPNATVTVDCPDGITTTACKKFDMAIEELVTNAVVHNHHDSPEVSINVWPTDSAVSITVVDNGPIIPEMDQDVLLQDNERTSLYHGSGLGLSLVRVLTARSGGSISVPDSSLDGNLIEIELPV
jgi:PAS domain S-box-containing protein